MSTPEPDPNLVARVAAGDERALTQLYEQNVNGLYAFVFYRVGRDATLAEDVVQETFVEALGRLDRYEPGRGTVRAWLCTMSRNVIRKHTRDRPRFVEVNRAWETVDQSLRELFEALDGGALSDEVLEREQTRDLVSATIANLPDHYRSALQSKYVEGESLEQLAKRLEVSEEAAKSLLARARRAFRETFLTMSREIEGALSTETV